MQLREAGSCVFQEKIKGEQAEKGWGVLGEGCCPSPNRVLEPDGAHEAFSQMKRIRLGRHAALGIVVSPFLPFSKIRRESQGDLRGRPSSRDLV